MQRANNYFLGNSADKLRHTRSVAYSITYKYQSPISNDINMLCCVCFYFVALDVSLGFHFLLCVCYVNPAYGCQIEINCVCKLAYFRLCTM